jgi:hypothetical protein
MMDDRIRISDVDRERVAARLREHYAEGRLSSDELEERIAAVFSAKTAGDLRHVLADLPEPASVPAGTTQSAPWAGQHWGVARRGPRLLPLALLVLFVLAVLPGGGWLLFGFFQLVATVFLVACLVGIVAAARFRRNIRRWQSGDGTDWRHYQWHGPA